MSEKEKFDVVLLSGGGIKGIGELGVLLYYQEKGMLDLDHVQEFVGTSIGSMINLLMVCGYTPMEIFIKIYTTRDIFNFMDFNDIWSVFTNYGIMSIQPLINIVEEMVKAKFGSLPTFLELKNLTGKLFTITSTNVNKARSEDFNYETRPHLGVVNAVKMSCNLPVIFHKIKYHGDYWVDGAVADGFPYTSVKNKLGRILGVVVAGTDREKYKDTFINYLYQMITIPMNVITHLRTKNIGKNVKLITVIFDDVPIIKFAMESKKKMDMFMKGYHCAQREEEKELLLIKKWTFYDTRGIDEATPISERLTLDFWSDPLDPIGGGWEDEWQKFDKEEL